MADGTDDEFDLFSGAPGIEPLTEENAPCVGCGWCCLTDPCQESHRRHGYVRRCPDLKWDEAKGRYLCGLMLDPDQGAEVRRSQHAGQGCYAPLNAWRKDVRNRDKDGK
ncbi:hypothetical protein [Pseudodesulfovibrio sp.]|uniref:hypothetical protein n=1 Tax=Pseudodesulfovibrio sp. TaxID=2035812 RepID=UPI003427A115